MKEILDALQKIQQDMKMLHHHVQRQNGKIPGVEGDKKPEGIVAEHMEIGGEPDGDEPYMESGDEDGHKEPDGDEGEDISKMPMPWSKEAKASLHDLSKVKMPWDKSPEEDESAGIPSPGSVPPAPGVPDSEDEQNKMKKPMKLSAIHMLMSKKPKGLK